MNCTRCSIEIRPEAKFCQECGNQLNFTRPEEKPKKNSEQGSRKIGTLSIALIIFFLYWMVNRQQRDDPDDPVKITKVVAEANKPTPTPTPILSPAQHLSEAKTLTNGKYDKDKWSAAITHLNAVPEANKGKGAAGRLFNKIGMEYFKEEAAGPEPTRFIYKVMCVDEFLRQSLNDFDSAEYLQWGPSEKVKINGYTYWRVGLKLRAKNGFGANVVRVMTFLILENRVVKVL